MLILRTRKIKDEADDEKFNQYKLFASKVDVYKKGSHDHVEDGV